MARFSHDVIIIGGGAGGLVTTVGCSKLGLKTALIERHTGLGGDCLFYGCVPSKSLLKSATVYHNAQHFPKYGLPQLKLPKPDLAKVNGRVQSVIKHIAQHDSIERFQKLGAEVLMGEARFLSEHEVRIDGEKTISAPKIVVATGSAPSMIPIPGLKETGFITNLDVFSLKTLPDHLIIIGAGPIGIEMSQAFSRLGSKVTVITIGSTILTKDDSDMTDVVLASLCESKVDFVGNAKIEKVEKHQKQKRISLEVEGKKRVITGDAILLAVGRTANTKDLECDKAGIRVERSFIPTNNKLQSSQKHILAVGDCNGQFLFTHMAAAEASVAVRRVALRAGGTINYRAVPWVTYTDPEMASIGHNEQSAQQHSINYRTIIAPLSGNDRALAEAAPEGKIKILIDKSEKILGIQIVGLHAGGLILPALFAVQQQWKASALMAPIYPYPTMGDIYKGAVGIHMGPKLFNNTVRGILKLLHRYRGKTKD